MYEVIIVGGGPAGLSAALVLGRCRRRVLLCDDGRPRNRAAVELHGFLTRDGIAPQELVRLGRAEIKRYDVELLEATAVSAQCCAGSDPLVPISHFEVKTSEGRTVTGRKLLLTTGVRDNLPDVAGLSDFYGRSVHHCPYCDGWEHRNRRLAALGLGASAVGMALSLRTWSEHVIACTQRGRLTRHDRSQLHDLGIQLREERVVRLEGSALSAGRLERIVFESGPDVECDALFFNENHSQRSALPAMLGCDLKKNGQVRTEGKQRTSIPGLYLAGDADGDVQFAIVAAAEGAVAGVAINRELQDEALSL